MAGQEVRAYNFAASDTAALVGPSRGRLQGVLVNAAAAAALPYVVVVLRVRLYFS